MEIIDNTASYLYDELGQILLDESGKPVRINFTALDLLINNVGEIEYIAITDKDRNILHNIGDANNAHN